MAIDSHAGVAVRRARDGLRERAALPAPALRVALPARRVAPYPASLRLLHWLTLVLVLAAIALGVLRAEVAGRTLRLWLLDAHRTVGLLVFAVTVLRLLQRLSLPIEPSPLPRLVGWIAHTTHVVLYLLLFGMPLLGVLLSNARSGSTRLFGVLPLPQLIAENDAWADGLQMAHYLGGWLLIGLVGVHATAALFHHYVLRDGVLARMLPQVAKRRG